MAITKRILFVEGDDDKHTILAICKRFDLPRIFRIDVPDGQGKINENAESEERGGIENVFKATVTSLIAGSSGLERLGIVIDADKELRIGWKRVRSILERAGYDKENIPDDPDTTGTVIKQEYLPTFGVWIMPNNQLHGMLEDFLEFFIPDKDTNKVWAKAVESSKEVLEMPEETFPAHHLSKAKMHAFLAWQKDSGRPFGTAITKKYLQIDNPYCETFVDWLTRLFIEA